MRIAHRPVISAIDLSGALDHPLACMRRLGVTGSTGVVGNALIASGGKALAADRATET